MPGTAEPAPPSGAPIDIIYCPQCSAPMKMEVLESDGKAETGTYKCDQCGHQEMRARIMRYDENSHWPE